MTRIGKKNKTWMEAVLDEASRNLAKFGDEVTSKRVQKIKQIAYFEESTHILDDLAGPIVEEFMHMEDIIDAMVILFEKLIEAYELRNLTFSVCKPTPGFNHKHMVVTTYTEAWVRKYRELEAWKYDPIFLGPLKTKRPFFWENVNTECPIVNNLFKLAIEHGVGNVGYTIPIYNKYGGIYSLTYTGSESARKFRARINKNYYDFHTISNIVMEYYLHSIDFYDENDLAAGEIEVLNEIYFGATREELIGKPFVYGSFLSHEKSILRKLKVKNIYHAVLIARERNMIDVINTSLNSVRHNRYK